MRFSTFLLLLTLTGLTALLCWRFPYVTLSSDQKYTLLYTLPWLVMLGSAALLHYRGRGAEMMRHFLYWCTLIIVILAGYSYRDIVLNNRIISSLIPQRAIVSGDGTVTFYAASDGHFYIETQINQVPVKFMVDTGASDITLSLADARRVGLQPENLSYSKSYHTANGVILGAPVVLEKMTVGPILLHHIPASVNRADMGTSLLGMEFFRHLRGFSVDGDVLTLKP